MLAATRRREWALLRKTESTSFFSIYMFAEAWQGQGLLEERAISMNVFVQKSKAAVMEFFTARREDPYIII